MKKTIYEITHERYVARTIASGYEITHERNVVRTIASGSPYVVRHMTYWMIRMSDENAGEFSSWRVEIDPETGRREYTRIASAKNGVKI